MIITAGVPQGFVLGSLLFLIYINYLTHDLTSIVKLFADETSLFSVVYDIGASAKELNEDLNKIDNWTFQWKMNFNPNPSKQTQKFHSVEIYIKCNALVCFLTKQMFCKQILKNILEWS